MTKVIDKALRVGMDFTYLSLFSAPVTCLATTKSTSNRGMASSKVFLHMISRIEAAVWKQHWSQLSDKALRDPIDELESVIIAAGVIEISHLGVVSFLYTHLAEVIEVVHNGRIIVRTK